ncbi:hypothetical protein PFAG_06113 [Plasmodium falciparum Santa Lucia]|uniref:Surface antigen n=1 Tax=Plasmodium falciparum Santa Lucia TaxID=478859 RepID=W7FVP1_PLAFA|nr:hypothetical protein PFAG_06113 [Plasmodium falciparum Santa Lucia]
MKVHYINILLFAVPLNILANTLKKPSITPRHIQTTRLLCECELYAPSNYENDQEMKEVMESFNRQSSERFREYDERMKTTRQKCKDKCDEAIQKIILKDKIEKQLSQQFSKLQTNIETNDIPTCVCEKSLADKTENLCLNCGKTMGAVTPAWGLICGIGYAGWSQYVATTVVKMSTDVGIQKGIEMGLSQIREIATQIWNLQASQIPPIKVLAKMTTGTFTDDVTFSGILKTLDSAMTGKFDYGPSGLFSMMVQKAANNPFMLKQFSEQATAVETAFNNAKTGILTKAGNVTSSLSTSIIVSVVAIVIIVLIMIIIYLILRYRRKKKMKKKLQYIKLLEE